MSNTSLVFLFVSLFCGISYLLTTEKRPFFGDSFIKGSSIFCLGLFIIVSCQSPIALVMSVAFCLASMGDVFLASVKIKNYFIKGLESFAISYILYAVVFFTKIDTISYAEIKLSMVVITITVTMYRVISDGLGTLKIPVIAYMSIINLMVISAICGDFGNNFIMIGAFLLLSSDIVIALGEFKKDTSEKFIKLGEYYTWGSYYVGQLLIAIGFVKCFG